MRIIALLLLLLLTPAGSLADNPASPTGCEITIDDFSKGISPDWKIRSFKGMTEYTWATENGRGFVKATSNNTASGLYYKIRYDPKQYPYITWQWKVDNIVTSGDATRKSGDDYSARVYVVFPAFFFWNTRAINYIWANRLPKGQAVANPFTSNNMMISVESGVSQTGKWLTESRNVYEDYKRLFGQEPPEVGAIAIMTDSDNTGESGSASYGPIGVCSRAPWK